MALRFGPRIPYLIVSQRVCVMSKEQNHIMWAIQYGITRPKHITRATGLSHDSVRQMVCRMAKSGDLIRVGRGDYRIAEVTE